MSHGSTSLISVIMPCYNAEQYITGAIESVLGQTYKHLELIIINDGSKDRSEEVIKSFNDQRIRYYYQENRGQAAASNTGIKLSKGDFIKFVDADDVINPVHLESQMKRLLESSDPLDVASCAWGRFYAGEPTAATFIPESVWRDLDAFEWLRFSLKQRIDMMGAWLWLIPRTLLEKVGGWDERLSLNNDFAFSVKLLVNAKRVLYSEEAKLYYRTYSGSLSVRWTRQGLMDALLSTQLGCRYLLNQDNSFEMQQLCANRYQVWIQRIYPQYPDVTALFQQEIDKLVKPNVKPEGSHIFMLLQMFVGWRLAKRIRQVFYTLGYLQLLNWKKKGERSFYYNK